MTCSLCDRPHYSRGWCSTHYMRWRRHGDPEWEPRQTPGPPKTYAERLERWPSNDRIKWRGTKNGRSTCPVCSRPAALRDDGTLRWHAPKPGIGSVECPGSGALPVYERRKAS